MFTTVVLIIYHPFYDDIVSKWFFNIGYIIASMVRGSIPGRYE